MARRMVSQSLLALALLASAAALPMMPFSKGLMGYGGMMGMPMGNPYVGSSYKTGSSYSNGNGEITSIPTSDRLTATHIRQTTPDTNMIVEAMHIVIKPAGLDDSKAGGNGGMGGKYGGMPMMGGMYGGMPMMGGMSMYGTGYGGLGMGLMGAMGGMGGMYGMYGMGGRQPEELEAEIEIILPEGIPTFQRFLVFSESADAGITNTNTQCLPSEQGAVLTQPSSSHMSGYGGGLGGGFGFGASMNMLGGYGQMGGHSMDPDFGVIATLNIQGGANAFKINGLGPFTKIDQIAGRGVLFCAEVVISVDGRPVCADDPEEAIPISFCQSLGYSTSDGSLNPTA